MKSPSSGPGTVVGDTHAASLTGNDTHALGNDPSSAGGSSGTGNTINANVYDAWANTVENTAYILAAVTPGGATNLIYVCALVRGYKTANAGTITYRLKENTITLASVTSASLAVNTADSARAIEITLVNQSVAQHTYSITFQGSTSEVRSIFAGGCAKPVTLSGSDTHAASLTGGSGTCQL
ncbi:hypothetical protein [Candidatus Nitrososphaera gargensis]|uniref:hypothetical protein n=1 Tax=Candidatus Nitrososphaera gargensis TaxID=497727 RepID=UPI0011E54BF7|nr:hypothetical protein [Candidatus Nitrososphaera gargensis]